MRPRQTKWFGRSMEAEMPDDSIWHHELVELQITSFRGSINGEHYYGRFHVHAKNEKIVGADGRERLIMRGGYGVATHPRDGTNVERIVGAKEAAYLNKKDNDGFIVPSFRLKPGDNTTRFNDIPTLVDAAKKIFPLIFGKTDILVREIEGEHDLWEALVAPTEIVEHLAADLTYQGQHKCLVEHGFLIKE